MKNLLKLLGLILCVVLCNCVVPTNDLIGASEESNASEPTDWFTTWSTIHSFNSKDTYQQECVQLGGKLYQPLKKKELGNCYSEALFCRDKGLWNRKFTKDNSGMGFLSCIFISTEGVLGIGKNGGIDFISEKGYYRCDMQYGIYNFNSVYSYGSFHPFGVSPTNPSGIKETTCLQSVESRFTIPTPTSESSTVDILKSVGDGEGKNWRTMIW